MREVRLIDETGKQLGIYPTAEALRLAEERELDLVEVAPTAKPPVCRLLDYGKFMYERARLVRRRSRLTSRRYAFGPRSPSTMSWSR